MSVIQDNSITTNSVEPASGQSLVLKKAGGTASITVATNGEATFAENIILTANKGLSFQNHSVSSATGASSTTSDNVLDDYEEGTWTPSVTEGAGSITIGTVSGNYVKIGKKVTANLSIAISSATSATIDTINGFPFICENLNARGIGILRENGVTGNIFQLRADKNSTSFTARRYDNNGGVATNYEFVGSVTYFTP